MLVMKGDVVKVRLADDCGDHPTGTVLYREARKVGETKGPGGAFDRYATYVTVEVRGSEFTVHESDVVALVSTAPLPAL